MNPPKVKPFRRVLLSLRAFVAKRALSLCWVLYGIGIIWVLLHPIATVTTGEFKCRNTYMSENALLVDSMAPTISYRQEQRVRELQKSFLSIPALPPMGCGTTNDCESVITWIEMQLQRIDRVDAFRHHYQSSINGKWYTNVYGILRAAPLADHKESIVLVAHHQNSGKGVTNASYSSVTVGLTILEYLSTHARWLAKDVILLFAHDGPLDGVDGVALGTDAWLQAYHENPVNVSSSLPMRAGLIRAAINLEMIGDIANANVVGLFTAGRNGQLPNLDLVNMAVFHTKYQGIETILDRCEAVQNVLSSGSYQRIHSCQDVLTFAREWIHVQLIPNFVPVSFRASVLAYLDQLFPMLRFMKTLATGPSGPHANFIRYNIDAITVSILDTPSSNTRTLSLVSILRSLELMVRSLSNLEEKLHQSFFLYVLPTTNTFISVGEYYYAVALILMPAIVHLLVIAATTCGFRLAFAWIVWLFVELMAVVLLVWGTQDSNVDGLALRLVVWTIIQLIWVFIVLPRMNSFSILQGNSHLKGYLVRMEAFNNKKNGPPLDPNVWISDRGWRVLKAVMLVLIVFAHCVLGVLNYPMALGGAIPMTLFSLVEPRTSNRSRLLHGLVTIGLCLSSPLVLFGLWTITDKKGLEEAWKYTTQSYFHETNQLTLPYLCLIYIPIQTLALCIFLFDVKKHDTLLERKQQ